MRHALQMLAISAWLCGCSNTVTQGTRGIETAAITRGVTTEQELVDQLGPPQGRGLDSKGRKLLTWNRMDVSGTGKAWIPVAGPFLAGSSEVRKTQLAVSIDSRGRVADFRTTNEEHEANIFGETDHQ